MCEEGVIVSVFSCFVLYLFLLEYNIIPFNETLARAATTSRTKLTQKIVGFCGTNFLLYWYFFLLEDHVMRLYYYYSSRTKLTQKIVGLPFLWEELKIVIDAVLLL